MSELALEHVSVSYGHGAREARILSDVNLRVAAGETLGLVGESGSGKSTLARAIAGLIPLTAGRIVLNGEDLSARSTRQGPSPVQLIFQNPTASLNPRLSIAASIAEALADCKPQCLQHEIENHLRLVGLSPALAARRPGEISGGQRQRVAIARALAARPQVILADEITSALDASVQASILNLLVRLQNELGFALIFISHNLAAVRYLSHNIAVMRAGHIVEMGEADALTRNPQHAYTRALLHALPSLRIARSPMDASACAENA